MNKFLKINTVYSDISNRNIDYLSGIYNDRKKIKEIIFEIIKSKLLNDNFLKNKTLLLKPNWVTHSNIESDEICLRTHNNFVLALLEILVTEKPKKIIIADAPIQGCKWELMITDVFINQVKSISLTSGILIEIKDLRKTTFDPNKNIKKNINSDDQYTIFDLKEESLLEPLALKSRNPFRITYYNPDRLKESHFPGSHKYCITNELFQADIVISLPKVKTHQKAGITCALKNLVGLNGDKDYLPHHRIGGTGLGGDCYPGSNRLRYYSELVRDFANRNIGTYKYFIGAGISKLIWELLPKKKTHSLSAGWYGNDTTWRMVADLYTIAVYGKADGIISATPQREIFSLCDGIIGGQGDGPLQPIPLPLGIISFTNQSGLNDIAMATLMGFDWKNIALLNHYSADVINYESSILCNGKNTNVDKLKEISIKTLPPPGWESYL